MFSIMLAISLIGGLLYIIYRPKRAPELAVTATEGDSLIERR
jgi:hypothetical protein